MLLTIAIFLGALALLLLAARFFTGAAEKLGQYLGLPPFIIGVFIVGIGTSLPELISGILSVHNGVSEIVAGNIMGANISNILLITGLAVTLNRKSITLSSNYLYIDLHFMVGSFMFFYMVAYDGHLGFIETFIGVLIFLVYCFYLIRGEQAAQQSRQVSKGIFPVYALLQLLAASAGIYFGADYTISSLTTLAGIMQVPNSIVALTLLSLGTTLPELAVNISAIRQGNAEMAIGNVLGSCVFNTLIIPAVCSAIGPVSVPANLLHFALPVMAGCGLLFYLLTQDKKISVWEGLLFICLYILFILKTAGV